MKPLPRWTLLAVAAALIVLANGVALLGVAYNRAAPPDSVLTLTEREAGVSYGLLDDQNAGIALLLQWRFEGDGHVTAAWAAARSDVTAPARRGWLDEAKLRALGVDLPAAGGGSGGADTTRWPLPVEVLLVLELDGPAHQQAVAFARAQAASSAAAAAGNPTDKAAQRRAENDRERLGSEELEQSRLFVVDAGRDRASLRSLYPDTTRHAIVRGEIGVTGRGRDGRPQASVESVGIGTITVPLQHRAVFQAVGPETGVPRKTRPFIVEIAIGRRLEPWVQAAKLGPPRPAGAASAPN